MGRMLVNDVELVMKFHQPVGVKQLADQLVVPAVFRLQKLFLKKVQLPFIPAVIFPFS